MIKNNNLINTNEFFFEDLLDLGIKEKQSASKNKNNKNLIDKKKIINTNEIFFEDMFK